jgi:hypothetical protein
VWRKISFGSITTTKIRVLVNNALASYSRITEIEAYVPGPLPSGFKAGMGAEEVVTRAWPPWQEKIYYSSFGLFAFGLECCAD